MLRLVAEVDKVAPGTIIQILSFFNPASGRLNLAAIARQDTYFMKWRGITFNARFFGLIRIDVLSAGTLVQVNLFRSGY